MKQVVQLDDQGYFVGYATAYESPLEPGVFLLPAGAVDAEVPAIPDGKRAKWTGQGWAFEDLPQPDPEPQPEPTAYVPTRAEQIRARLHAIDQESIRPARAVAAALADGKPAPAFDASKLTALETEAATLRAELASIA